MDFLNEKGNLLIKTSEIATLNKYNINVDKVTSIDEALFLIDAFLNDAYDLTDEEYEELDYVATNLAERKYYWETHK